jgi:hypothetical protein
MSHSKQAQSSSLSTVTTGNVNILLHGLFFMEANGNNLEIYAPPTVSHHSFQGGVRGNIVDLNSITAPIDWSGGVLTGKTTADPSEVKPTILQFSRQNTVGAFQPKQRNRLIILPWPKQFFSMRLSGLDGFKYDHSGSATIGKEIERRCGAGRNKVIGLVTGLQYSADLSGPVLPGETLDRNIHFYYDPGLPHDIHAVNDDLKKSKAIFSIGDGFDLQMDENAPYPTTPLDDPGNLPDIIGLTPEDGLTLNEPVKTGVDQLVKKFFDAVISLREPEDHKEFIDRVHAMINPANCPNFFVLP